MLNDMNETHSDNGACAGAEPALGATAAAEIEVLETDLASAVGREPGDTFPRVLATTRMVALMETAAARLLKPLLQPGQLSVGVEVAITHTAATPAGTRVSATARYRGRDGKRFLFDVRAHDSGGEIGHGTHKRAIVSADRLEAGAARRNGVTLSKRQ